MQTAVNIDPIATKPVPVTKGAIPWLYGIATGHVEWVSVDLNAYLCVTAMRYRIGLLLLEIMSMS